MNALRWSACISLEFSEFMTSLIIAFEGSTAKVFIDRLFHSVGLILYGEPLLSQDDNLIGEQPKLVPAWTRQGSRPVHGGDQVRTSRQLASAMLPRFSRAGAGSRHVRCSGLTLEHGRPP